MQEKKFYFRKIKLKSRMWVFPAETYYIGEEESRMAELEMLEQGHQLYAVEGTPRAVQVLPGLSCATQISRCFPRYFGPPIWEWDFPLQRLAAIYSSRILADFIFSHFCIISPCYFPLFSFSCTFLPFITPLFRIFPQCYISRLHQYFQYTGTGIP